MSSFVASLVVAASLTGGVGNAHGWGPSAALWADSLGQKGKLYAARDTDCGPSDCTTGILVGRPSFPDQAFSIGPDPRAVEIEAKLERLLPRTTLQYWEELDHRGRPVGDPVPIEHRLTRIGSNEWRVRFTTPELAAEAFIAFRAHWRNPDLGDREYARFGFHLSS